jgi:hypothetical protein
MKAKQQARQLEYVRKLHNSPENYDVEILSVYEKAVAEAPPTKAPIEDEEYDEGAMAPATDDWLLDLAPRLGKYPDGNPHPTALQTSLGGASRNGLMLDIYLSFESLPSGLLALIEWLSQQGCSTFKYSI